MNFLDNIERAFKLILKSINVFVGVVVGALLGALISILMLILVSDGFSFSGGWYWRLLPGTVFGAVAGVKIWPLMLNIVVGGDDVSLDFDSDSGLDEINLKELPISGAEDSQQGTQVGKDDNGNSW